MLVTRVFFTAMLTNIYIKGGLALAIEGPSKAEIICEGNKDGTCSVSYLPTAPGKYLIAVKFDEKHIPGSPYCAYITGNICYAVSDVCISILQ